jgi:RHS repeat-associated protein
MVCDESYNLTTLHSQNHIDYSYDATGRVVNKHNKTEQKESSYTYTPSGALSQATSTPLRGSGTDLVAEQSRSIVTRFSYNKAGNQTQNEQQYNSLNQLIEDREYLYAYDKRGNLQEKLHKSTAQRTLYVFNLFDQLEKVKTIDKEKKLIEGFSFSYDALNRRVSKTTYTSTGSAQVPNSSTQHYLYDEENIIAILDHNKELLASIIHDANTDTPLSITTHQNEPNPLNEYEKHKLYTNLTPEEKLHIYQSRQKRTYYYHRDHQGSITALTNEEGDIVESFLYDEAYGTILDHHTTEETYNPYCYTGREFDTHDLYYYRARYYDPSIGRFISQDPIEFRSMDFNFYRYVSNDPVNYADPSGLSCEVQAAAGAALGSAVGAVGGGGLSLACDAASSGLCIVINGPILAGTTALGAAGGALIGEAACELGELLGDLVESAISETETTTGIQVESKVRECGDKKPYKDQKPDSEEGNKRKDRPDNEKMDADHMPSKADVTKDMKSKYKGKVRKSILDCMSGEVEGLMESLVIPKDVHDAKTATTSPNRNKTKAERDAFREENGRDRTLSEQAEHEANTIEDEVDKNDKIKKECADLIKKGLDFFKNLTQEYFDDIYKDALKICKNK